MSEHAQRQDVEALGASHPELVAFLSDIPAADVWLCDPDAGDPVTNERLRRAAHGLCHFRVADADLALLNRNIRAADGPTDRVVEAAWRGERRAFRIRTLPVGSGRDRRLAVAVHDVTVEQGLEDQLRRSADALRELHLGLDHTTAEAIHLALADPLTGLPNRRAFDTALADACERGGFALALLDIDRFKEVNDALGHTVGDRLLCAIGERLRRHTRTRDVVARLAGDEFAVLLADVGTVAGAEEAVGRLLGATAEKLDLGEVDIRAGMTAGVAVGVAGIDPAVVFRQADTALHTAKGRRRGSVAVHDSGPGGLEEHDDLVLVKTMLSSRLVPLTAEPALWADGTLAGLALTVDPADLGGRDFDTVVDTAVRFGLGEEISAVLFRELARAAAERCAEAPVHVRIPAAAARLPGVAVRLLEEMEAAGATLRALVVEVPLAPLADGSAEDAARAVREAGAALAVGDWDMSVAAFRRALAGDVAMVKLDTATPDDLLQYAGMDAVLRSALATLGTAGVPGCARGIDGRASAERLFALGAAMAQGRALAPDRGVGWSARPVRLNPAA